MLNFDKFGRYLSNMSFREAVWLFPLAYTLHVAEEWPQFPNWAARYASPQFTRRDYLIVHLAGIVVAFLSPVLLRLSSNRVIVFAFFAFVFTPAVFFNVFFHAGATAAYGAYSPGLLTALAVYPPLFLFISRRARREGLLSDRQGAAAFVIAGAFHAADVAHNVFRLL